MLAWSYWDCEAMQDDLLHLPDRVRSDDVSVLTLEDGRELAYSEWGDRAGYPVFYFHGTPGSHLEGAFADHAAGQHGFRLIAVDRPGFGRSTFQEGRLITDWPSDLCSLADALKIDEFGAVGHSGAGPYLFACGALVETKRLKFIGALSPWGSVATPEIAKNLNVIDRTSAKLSRHAPRLMRASFVPVGWCVKHCPSLFFYLLRRSVSAADQDMMRLEDFMRHFRAAEFEAFRQGTRGLAHEVFIAFHDWGFDVAMIKVPIHIWLGDRDIFVPREMGEYLERAIPNVDFHWVQGEGHFIIEKWDDVFAVCASHI